MEEFYEPGFRAPIKTWLPVEEIEPSALDQLRNTARHPEAALHIAVMPDCHVGYGVTIGSVVPTADAVLPNAVGVDIGCGMCALDTGIPYDRTRMDRTFWQRWADKVARDVPTGFRVHAKRQRLGGLDRPLHATKLQPLIKEKGAVQLGTLGGGNHFLEAQYDEAGMIWLMVHSGSRHTGLRIARYYNDLAVESTRRRGLTVHDDLASPPLDDRTGQHYLDDMQWATDFALENRRRMMEAMHRALLLAVTRLDARYGDVGEASTAFINIHHNFAQVEVQKGERVMVHRKGATSAYAGQLGIIPGSMGSPSFIVRGLGNEEGLQSCSHGAGRRLGRNMAKRAISEASFAASLKGTFSRPSMSYVDEAPEAYKNIDIVINRQRDLVEIVHTLNPIITVKGDSRAKED